MNTDLLALCAASVLMALAFLFVNMKTRAGILQVFTYVGMFLFLVIAVVTFGFFATEVLAP